MSLVSTSADSVTVSWRVPEGTVVERYEIQWRVRDEESQSMSSTHTEESLSSSTDQYTISGLQQTANGTIEVLVTAVNGAGISSSIPLTLHSNALQRNDVPSEESGDLPSEEDSAEPDSDALSSNVVIGGAVGIFFVSLVIGVLVAVVVLKVITCSRKKEKLVCIVYFSNRQFSGTLCG